jgi:hypothetical protein
MAIDPTVRRSRRAVLGAALGGAAAAAATSLVAASPALADTGDAAVLGQGNAADEITSFENTTDGHPSLQGLHSATGTGVVGTSVDGIGAAGRSTDSTPSDYGTKPSNRTGVWGVAGDETDAAQVTDETGIYGYSDLSENAIGVWGDSIQGFGVYASGATGLLASGPYGGVVAVSDSLGIGVWGHVGGLTPTPIPSGVGVYARSGSTSMLALQVEGRVRFSRSGRTYLTASAKSRTIKMPGVTTRSYIIATVQTNASGVYVRSVVPASGKFTIHLSKAGGKRIYVGYFVIN